MCIRDSPWVAPVYGLADGVGVGPRVGVGDGVVPVPPVAQAATARAAVATSAAMRPTRAGRGVRTGTRFLRGGEIEFGVGGRGRCEVGRCEPGGQSEGYSGTGRDTGPRSGSGKSTLRRPARSRADPARHGRHPARVQGPERPVSYT